VQYRHCLPFTLHPKMICLFLAGLLPFLAHLAWQAAGSRPTREFEELGFPNSFGRSECKCTCRDTSNWNIDPKKCGGIPEPLSADAKGMEAACKDICKNEYQDLVKRDADAEKDQKLRNSIPEEVCLGDTRNLFTQYRLTNHYQVPNRRCWLPDEEQKCVVLSEPEIKSKITPKMAEKMALQMAPKTCDDVSGARARRFGGGCKCNPGHTIFCLSSFPEVQQKLPGDVFPTDQWAQGPPGEKFLFNKALAACDASGGILYCAQRAVDPPCTKLTYDMEG